MIAHRVGSKAWEKSRQRPIPKYKRERPRRISERSRDWDLEQAREWTDLYLPDLDQSDPDRIIRASHSIQAQLAAGECPTIEAIPPAPIKARRTPTVSAGLTCPRCAQAFKYPTGRQWHLANRPQCKAESQARASRIAA